MDGADHGLVVAGQQGTGLLLTQGYAIRPFCALVDPVADEVGLRFWQRSALLGRRHQVVVVGRQNSAGVNLRGLGVTTHEGLGGEEFSLGVHPQVPLGVAFFVTGDAVDLKDGFDLFNEVHFLFL